MPGTIGACLGRTTRALTIVLAALACAAVPAHGQHALVTLPLDDPAYEQLAALERLGCNPARVSPFRPYRAGAVRAALRVALNDTACAGPILEALRARFIARAVDSVRAPMPATTDSAVAADTLAGVAPDLVRAIREEEDDHGRPVGEEGRFRFGARADLALTTLSKGEFEPLWESVRPTGQGTPAAVARLRARVTWEGGPRLVAVVEPFAQSHRRNDPLLRERALRTTTGSVGFREAYIAGALGKLVLSFGRSAEAWLGRGDESLMLSAHGPAYDRLVASIATRRFEARAIAASLNDVVLDTTRGEVPSGVPPQRFYRMLVGHALVWRPAPSLELTFGETALLSRGSRSLDGAYLNPLMIYVVTQNDTGRESNRDNLTTFGAARVRVGPTTLTGELLVDDIQIDPADRKKTPDQLGWRLQATTPLPLAWPASGTVEYRHVNSYTYMRANYDQVYQQFDRPLGSELGPDADDLRATGELWPSGRVRLAGSIGRWRRGVLRIDERPGQRATGNAGKPFPSTGPGQYVQSALLSELAAQLLSARIPVTARLQLARIENVNNTLSGPALYVRAQLIGSYAFRYP